MMTLCSCRLANESYLGYGPTDPSYADTQLWSICGQECAVTNLGLVLVANAFCLSTHLN